MAACSRVFHFASGVATLRAQLRSLLLVPPDSVFYGPVEFDHSPRVSLSRLRAYHALARLRPIVPLRVESSCIDSPVQSHRLVLVICRHRPTLFPGHPPLSLRCFKARSLKLAALSSLSCLIDSGLLSSIPSRARALSRRSFVASCCDGLSVLSAQRRRSFAAFFFLSPSRLERSRNRLCPIFDLFFGHGCSLVPLVRLCAGSSRPLAPLYGNCLLEANVPKLLCEDRRHWLTIFFFLSAGWQPGGRLSGTLCSYLEGGDMRAAM